MNSQIPAGIRICSKFLLKDVRTISIVLPTRYNSSSAASRRVELFTKEQKRQMESVGRIEKIEVHCVGPPEDTTLMMNKDISTPYNCAQHISEMLCTRTALALIDDTTLWDVHRPLPSSCKLQFLHFRDSDPYHVNKAFWRSCSFLLGHIAETSFKDDVQVKVHSFPPANVRSGSFVHDVDMDLDNWQPTQVELRVLSGRMVEFCKKNLPFERLSIKESVALEMFEDNPHKCKQIPHIAAAAPDGLLTVYRVGDYVDISRGPMIADTSFVGKCTISAVHIVESDEGHRLYRFQGVALPKGIMLNHVAYNILENRSKTLNVSHMPSHNREKYVSHMPQQADEKAIG